MATALKKVDKYSNIIDITFATTADATLAFEEVNLGMSMFEKKGLLIHKWYVEFNNNFVTEMNQESDRVRVALTQSSELTSISLGQPSVIDMKEFEILEYGTAGNAQMIDWPSERDYCNLPGGGLLVSPRPLYAACITAGFGASVSTITTYIRLFFTLVDLKGDEYFELLETRHFFG